ncbi:threonine--tRNA ligase [Candidatus Saccharibacteria bacterium QS_5_54_17]|nr:MAG: threonine--tRNA ligase [Candidatus Saccharibacteria bacterium QS_5_54_17]
MSSKEKNADQLHAMRHSLAHIMAAAIQKLWPEAKFGVGPVTETGFYYDVDLGEATLTPEDLPKIEAEMRKIIEADLPLEQFDLPIAEAIEREKQAGQDYKVALLQDLQNKGTTAAEEVEASSLGVDEENKEQGPESVSYYQLGDFVDLCRGPHVESTGQVGAFKLHQLAGAYWRGDENNPMLQRVYGVAFPTQEEVDEYFELLEEAKKRDHKKLGKDMELFFFDETAPGMAYWLPKGLGMKNLLIEYWRQYHKERGYMETQTPLLNKKELWETSGHWQHYQDDMFTTQTHDGEVWGLKPMNCPNAMTIFKSRTRSYRDLPLRLSDADTLHRNEPSGTLNGLLRIRSFQQDDSHNFVTEDQVQAEVRNIVAIIKDFYKAFGLLDGVKLKLATRPEDYMGDKATWERAESELRSVLEESGMEYGVMEGDGAFYGPKIDIYLMDALKREWQCGTVQLDFQQPRNFDLTYTSEDGSLKQPIVIHRVIYGSLERFIGIITEHFNGRFPFWFAPEQVRILTINDQVLSYVAKITNELSATVLMEPVKYNEVRFTTDDRNESLGKKIREAETAKVPVMLIVGPKDEQAGLVSVRTRDGEQKVKLEELPEFLQNQGSDEA